MKTLSLGRLIVGVELVILGGIVLHAPFSVGMGMLFPDSMIVFKVWKEILLGAGLAMVVALVAHKKAWRRVCDDWVVRIAAVYALLHLLLLGYVWRGIEAGLAGLLIDLRYVLFFVLVYITLQLLPQYRRLFVATAIGGVVVVIGFALLQLTILPHDILKYIGYSQSTIVPYLTVDLNHEYIRINSTLRGPNPLGAYAAMCLALVAAYVTQYRRKVPVPITGFLGILAVGILATLWASYSRSAIVAAMIMLFMIIVIASGVRLKRWHWVTMVVVVCAVIGGIIAARDTAFVSNVVLHENPQSSSKEKSNDGHVASLHDGTRRMLSQPFGDGVGSTGSASLRSDEPVIIENQYLAIAHEVGWLGLVIFMSLFGVVIWRLWCRRDDWLALGLLASGVGLALVGLLQPVWMDDTVSLVWWGLAGVAIAITHKEGRRGKRHTNHKKTA